MTYTPNWNDPRVQSRVKRALLFCDQYLSDTPQRISTRFIDQSFGSQRNDLSKYLRDQLLICVDDYYNKDTGVCKKYILNTNGRASLREMNNTYTHIHYSVVDLPVNLQEQLATGNFAYADKSSRLYNPLQNLPRASKKEILESSGYLYHYDIQCCAPTLIMYKAHHCGMSEYLFGIRDYFKDRKSIRQQIAQECELTEDQVKRIINGLFQGARLSSSYQHQSLIYKEVQGDVAKIEFLKQHPLIIELRSDIKTCWSYITPTLPKRYSRTSKGYMRSVPLSGKRKAGLYRDLERSVLEEIRCHLDQTDNRYLLEHDGWSCQREIDVDFLENLIKQRLDYTIVIERDE